MYHFKKPTKTTLDVNQTYEGESIENKVRRITNNREPIKDTAPLIYTERKDGVQPAYDIRTDRFDLALDATDKIAQHHLAKRKAKVVEMKDQNQAESGKTEGTK